MTKLSLGSCTAVARWPGKGREKERISSFLHYGLTHQLFEKHERLSMLDTWLLAEIHQRWLLQYMLSTPHCTGVAILETRSPGLRQDLPNWLHECLLDYCPHGSLLTSLLSTIHLTDCTES